MFLLAAPGCGRPPAVELDAARRALAKAGEAGGTLRAPAACAGAQAALAEAEVEARLQARKPPWSRRYRRAGALAARALESARSCAAHARAARDLRRTRAAAALADLQAGIARTTALARHVPDGEGIQDQLLRAAISLGEGRTSQAHAQYERAEDAAARGREQIAAAVRDIDHYIETFRASPRRAAWRRWVRETVAESRREKRPVIVIDKLRRQLLVVRGDEELASYDVDLGAGGMDSKTRAGDEFTPEGRYRVLEARGPGRTRYHRALLLDYPNAEDRARFAALKRAGRVPRGGSIGGNIEIHGEGGRARDWTQGCVALSNQDMDELAGWASEGTRVTIVGMIPDGALE